MKRRNFIRTLGPALAAPFFLNGLPVRAYGRSRSLAGILSAMSDTDRVLVLVQLAGGNDGINTVIPLDQYATYASVRSNIAIPESSALKISDTTALHPAMGGLRDMYDNGTLRLVQGVCYPNPNQSHFRATDIWMSGSEYDQYVPSGWMGRYLDREFPGYPTGYPNAAMPDPLAIQIGSVISLALQGPSELMGIAIQDPQTFYDLVNGVPTGGEDDVPNTKAGKEITYIRQVQAESEAYSTVIKVAADLAQNKATYPSTEQGDRYALAEQLKIVARLIAGGLKTRVYVVSLGGFDTHDSQVDSTDPTSGSHATLLRRLSEAIAAFQSDLALLGVQNRVIGMTFSEFGRRVKSNNGRGTDHGTAAPMFVFGSMVIPGMLGANPSLTDLTNDNLKMQYDYRQVYASVLEQWFQVNDGDVSALLFENFDQVPIIRQSPTAAAGVAPGRFALAQNYPNPFNPSTTIAFELPAECGASITVYDTRGRSVAVLFDKRLAAGRHEVLFEAGGLSSGTYVYRLHAGEASESRLMTLAK